MVLHNPPPSSRKRARRGLTNLTLLLLSVLLVSAALAWRISSPPLLRSYDVVVVGAGTGGTAAALQAARLGARVALLEETDWIGGQMTAAGVSTMDGGHDSGIYKEFHDGATAFYAARGKSVSTCSGSDQGRCFEPSAARRVLERLLQEERARGAVIDLYTRTQVAAVLKQAKTVTGVRTARGDELRSRVVIDATEYGDVIPLAGVRYRVGNGTGDAPDPRACIQDITYAAVIRKYPGGIPRELRMTTPPPGYDEEVKRRFATIVTRNGSPSTWGPYPHDFGAHNAYRGLPDSLSPGSYTGLEPLRITKTGVNWANDYPAELPYIDYPAEGSKLSVRYLEERGFRRRANCAAKLKTLQFLYYVQNELGESQWSVATEEGYDTPYNREENSCPNIPAELKAIERHLPLIPYVRESRRILGLHTITASEIKRVGDPPRGRIAFPSSVAVGDYPNDLHNCSSDDTLERSLESREDVPEGWTPGFFQVPFEAFIPQQVDGFLAAEKNLSASRLVSGAIRLQPITMMTGQAAGAIAALAVQRNIQPRQLDPAIVQRALLDAGAAISQQAFTDVPAGHARWKAVQFLSARGIMPGNGEGRFGVDDPLTRAQAAVALVRQAGLPVPSSPVQLFADVPPGSFGFAEIEASSRARLLPECGPRRFCPDRPVTRAELMALLDRALGQGTRRAPAMPSLTGRSSQVVSRGQAAALFMIVR